METLEGLKSKGFDYLKKITAVDYGEHLDVLYMLYDLDRKLDETVTVRLRADSAEVPTVMRLYKSADWYECELSEMFGIKIKGRDTKRLLLEEWDGTDAPLKKSFRWGRPPGVPGGYIGVGWQ